MTDTASTTAVAAGDAAVTAVAQLDAVTVQYGARTALQDVSALFPPGAVGLLGPNGAGKSTLFRALLGLLEPARGRVTVLGLDTRTAALEARARIGFMPERDAHIPGMTAVAFVAYCAELAGLPAKHAMQRAHEVLHYVGLGDARYRTVDTYSTGMKQRVKLAQAIAHDPDLLLLDEPTNGMDPKGREEMLELVRDIAHRKGMHVIAASHLLPDIESTCDHVVVLDAGRVAAQGPIAALKAPGRRLFELRVKGDAPRFLQALHDAGIEAHAGSDALLRVYVPEDGGTRELFALAVAAGVQVRHLRPGAQTLEDVFARATGAS